MGAGDRLKVSFPARLSQHIRNAAASNGQTATEWVMQTVGDALEMPGPEADSVPLSTTPEMVVVVRLAARKPSDRRAGWVEGMSDDDWWDASHGFWRLSATTRSASRVLAAADPHGVVRHVWRVHGWQRERDGTKYKAIRGRPITDSADPADQELRQALLGRSVPPHRNPVRIVSGESEAES